MFLKSLLWSAVIVGSFASTAVLANPVTRKPAASTAPALSENYRRMFCGDADQPDIPMGYSVEVSREIDRLQAARKGLTVGEALDSMRAKYCSGRGQS